MNLWQIFEPTTAIYGLAGISYIGILCLLRASARRICRRQITEVVSEEDGAAYTISYVMVIPVYALLICIMIETAALFPAKIGSIYSAFAAARTGIVWSSATTNWQRAEDKAIAAGRRAFVPFASATQGFSPASITSESARYVVAHQQFADMDMKEKYLLSKFDYAQRSLKVTVTKPETWNSEVTAAVIYEFPFNVPGVARIFGERRDDGTYYLPIKSSVTLINQGIPDSGIQTSNANLLGIGYGTFE